MTPSFKNEVLWEQFKEEIFSWLHTKYRRLQKTKGVAADCTYYITESLVDTGFLTGCDYPPYFPSDWFTDPENSMIYNGFMENFAKYTAGDRKWIYEEWKQNHETEEFRGDVLLFTIRTKTLLPNHAGVYVGNNEMIHNSENSSVRTAILDDRWKKHLVGFFRLHEGSN